MRVAIIGSSGMIAQNIAKQLELNFSTIDLYDRTNIDSIGLHEYERVYISAISAKKWIANSNPIEDKLNIDKLLNSLENIRANQLIFISTVDVYNPPNGDELTKITEGSISYGGNRFYAEKQIKQLNSNCLIVRLQGIIADNLKKNVLFDLRNNNMLECINVDSKFQFYPISRLCSDIDLCLKNDIKLINLSCIPIQISDILEIVMRKNDIRVNNIGTKPSKVIEYNVKSIHADIFGGIDGYCVGYDESIKAIENYCNAKPIEFNL